MTDKEAISNLNQIYGFVSSEIQQSLDLAIKALEERKQGKWGKHGECPFCSYIRQWEDDNFCGNCGAKLQKGGAE